MSVFGEMSRDPDVVESRAMIASMVAEVGAPECVGDFAVRFVTYVSRDGDCLSCLSLDGCDRMLGFRVGQISSPALKCLGDAAVRGSSENCLRCRSTEDNCGAIIDERIYRANPGIYKRYAYTAGGSSLSMGVGHRAPLIAIVPEVKATVPCVVGVEITSTAISVSETATAIFVVEPGEGRGRYHFPGDDLVVTAKISVLEQNSTERLLEILDTLAVKVSIETRTQKSYEEIRYYVIAISLILNLRGACPPRFRSVRTPPPPKAKIEGGTDWASLLSNDRQVIDLHWLFCNAPSVKPQGKWDSMFRETGLDFRLASKFVATVGGPDAKLVELGLPSGEMILLAALQTAVMRNRWRDLKKRAGESLGAFRQWVADQKKRTTDTAEDLSLQFKILGLVGENYSHAAKIVMLCSGKKTTAKNMERRWALFQSMGLLRKTEK